MPEFYLKKRYIPVSYEFIEEYMPKANATFVKIYLYALFAASIQKNPEYLDIAKALNLLESDVVQAFNYWQEQGLVTISGNSVIFNEGETEAVPAAVQPVSGKNEKIKLHRPEYTQTEIATAISESNTLSDMVQLAQEILGKPLNPTDVETLFWFYDGLKFSPEVILMLLEYCVSKEKRRMSYIESVAISWHERGISGMEAVNEYIKKESEKNSFIYSVRKIFGITDRAISQTEEKFINRWHDMYKMDESMISMAYEQCIIQTAKLSFPYIEKILERWHKGGIHTPAQAEKDNRNFKENHSQPQVPAGPSSERGFDVYYENYDHESLEKLTRNREQ